MTTALAQVASATAVAHNAVATHQPPAPTLTAFTDADPCPRVEIVVSPMPTTADTITVWRQWSGRRSQVRDAVGVTVSGAFLVVDYEAPLGVPLIYTCETADANGVASELSAEATVTVDVSTIWMQDALDPTSAIEVQSSGTAGITAIGDSFAPMIYELTGQVLPIVGSRDPVAVGGTRRAASQVPLSLITRSASDTTAVRVLWDQAFPLCVRVPSTIPQHDGLMYLAFTEFREAPYPGWDKTLFTAVADSVRGPGLGVIVNPRQFDHLLDEAATFTDLIALYPTFLDVQRGP